STSRKPWPGAPPEAAASLELCWRTRSGKWFDRCRPLTLVRHGDLMFHHVKKLMYTVRVGSPDPRFGNMLLEQFGGANGELAAAMQYYIQGLNADDPGRK